MSQFSSLSDEFRKSLDGVAERLASRGDDARPLFAKFVNDAVMGWYDGLDQASKAEVRRTMAAICSLSGDESAALAKQAGVVSPLGLLDSMLVDDSAEQPTEISQES